VTFDAALDFTLRWEGGYVNDPDDLGGATNRGVTQATYDAWRRRQGLLPRDVRDIEADELRAIYRTYWDAVRGDDVAPVVAAVLFDHAVNAGPERAIRLLQAVCGVAVDGIFGPLTMREVLSTRDRDLAATLTHARAGYYVGLVSANPRLAKFLRGWLARVHDQRARLGLYT
jgi:lysozyme family protein